MERSAGSDWAGLKAEAPDSGFIAGAALNY